MTWSKRSPRPATSPGWSNDECPAWAAQRVSAAAAPLVADPAPLTRPWLLPLPAAWGYLWWMAAWVFGQRLPALHLTRSRVTGFAAAFLADAVVLCNLRWPPSYVAQWTA